MSPLPSEDQSETEIQTEDEKKSSSPSHPHPHDHEHVDHVITVFSSIQGIAQSLHEADPTLPLQIIDDEQALGGYGGTVEFNPAALSTESKYILKHATILISEPAVIASLLDYDEDALSSLRWCQSTYAGVDPLFNSAYFQQQRQKHQQQQQSSSQPHNNNNNIISWKLTRFAGCFGPPISEWCLARIIEHERSFTSTLYDQQHKSWAGSKERVLNYRYLSKMTLVILGCGDIGRSIGRVAKVFGMRVIGYVRTLSSPDDEQRSSRTDAAAVGDGKEVSDVDEYTTDLTYALQSGDYIVSVLPSTPETRGLLSNDVLSMASKEKGGLSPVFINVGRGDVIDEKSLLKALDEQWISGAILDVFEEEPLPMHSKLWSRSDVIVSPHVSGLTQSSDVPKVFLTNYQRYIDGKDLNFLVDWNKGY
jgi:phosphoglycerate dehydrogenase-like enzyme